MNNNIEKIKFRNAISTDSKQLSDVESEIFFNDKVNTKFEVEIEKGDSSLVVALLATKLICEPERTLYTVLSLHPDWLFDPCLL